MTIEAMSALLTKPGEDRVEQTLGSIVADPVNIREFGATGGGSTDDSAAINAAIASGRAIYFPAGTYRAYQDIVYTAVTPPVFIGEHHWDGINAMSRIIDYRDYTTKPLITREDGHMLETGAYAGQIDVNSIPFGQPVILKNMLIDSTVGEYSSCLDLLKMRHAFIEACLFVFSYRGVTLSNWTFDSAVNNCSFRGRFFTPSKGNHAWPADRATASLAWGIGTAGHTRMTGIDCVGAGVGIRATGVECNIQGCRFEVNGYGLHLGGDILGIEGTSSGQLSRSTIGGVSMEANAIGMAAVSLSSTSVAGCGIQGSAASPGGGLYFDSECGLLVEKVERDASIEDVQVGGYFTRASIINDSTSALSRVVAGANPGGIRTGGQNRVINAGSRGAAYHMLATPLFPYAVSARHQTVTSFHDLMLAGLTGINIRDRAGSGDAEGGPVFAKNLGGVATPSDGATTAAVVFTAGLEPNAIAFSAAPAAVGDEESALEPGAYTYATTCIGQGGETSVNANTEKVVEVGEGESVSMSFYGTAQPVKRRIYRAGADGWYDGYWEQDGHSPFTDDGSREFDGMDSPPSAGSVPSRAEDDANYQIIATPSWATTVHVSDKTTAGFTLNFGTAAPDGSQTVAWLLFRP